MIFKVVYILVLFLVIRLIFLYFYRVNCNHIFFKIGRAKKIEDIKELLIKQGFDFGDDIKALNIESARIEAIEIIKKYDKNS